MINIIRKPLNAVARRLFGDETGAASVELVLVFPFFVGVFISAFEVAMMNMRAVMVERATDIAVRAIRLNNGADIEYEDVRDGICAIAFVIPDCTNSLKIQMTPVDPDTWATLPDQVDCVRRDEDDIEPIISFENGQQNELMLVRVCAVVDPIFPTIGVGKSMPKDSSGGYLVISSSAFVNEPN